MNHDTKVKVKGSDYEYEGWIVSAFAKRNGKQRFVVEDDRGRLFIHNAKQLGMEDDDEESSTGS